MDLAQKEYNEMRKEKQTQVQRIAMLENIVGQLYQRQNEILEQINKDKTIIHWLILIRLMVYSSFNNFISLKLTIRHSPSKVDHSPLIKNDYHTKRAGNLCDYLPFTNSLRIQFIIILSKQFLQ